MKRPTISQLHAEFGTDATAIPLDEYRWKDRGCVQQKWLLPTTEIYCGERQGPDDIPMWDDDPTREGLVWVRAGSEWRDTTTQ